MLVYFMAGSHFFMTPCIAHCVEYVVGLVVFCLFELNHVQQFETNSSKLAFRVRESYEKVIEKTRLSAL
jgi:hypothetical protein